MLYCSWSINTREDVSCRVHHGKVYARYLRSTERGMPRGAVRMRATRVGSRPTGKVQNLPTSSRLQFIKSLTVAYCRFHDLQSRMAFGFA